jgi:hypothetical protein
VEDGGGGVVGETEGVIDSLFVTEMDMEIDRVLLLDFDGVRVSDGDFVADFVTGVFVGVTDLGDRDTDIDSVALFVALRDRVSDRDEVNDLVVVLESDGDRVVDFVPVGVLEGLFDAFGVFVTDRVCVGVLVGVRVSEIELESDFVTEMVRVGVLLFAASILGVSSSTSSRALRRRRRTVGGSAPKNPPTNSSWLKSENRFSANLYVELRALCSFTRT